VRHLPPRSRNSIYGNVGLCAFNRDTSGYAQHRELP
jgi:hypothetical protein